MNYIPISRIQQNLELINDLPIPYDLIQHIKTYCDDYLPIPIEKVGENVDKFWVNLGIEICNLIQWNIYCFYTLQHSFGKTKFNSLWSSIEKFQTLRCLLDDLVCGSYQRNIYSIQINNQDIKITNIFYNDGDIIEYPYKKNKKIITLQDKNYIIKCIERTNFILNYLEKNIDKLPVNMAILNLKDYSNIKKNIKKYIKTLINCYNKMSQIINNIIIL